MPLVSMAKNDYALSVIANIWDRNLVIFYSKFMIVKQIDDSEWNGVVFIKIKVNLIVS